MSLFDQLAELDVPPPPATFDHELHNKLNRSLASLHVFDLFVRALPMAAGEFARAVLGFLSLTLIGKYPKKGTGNREQGPEM